MQNNLKSFLVLFSKRKLNLEGRFKERSRVFGNRSEQVFSARLKCVSLMEVRLEQKFLGLIKMRLRFYPCQGPGARTRSWKETAAMNI